MFKSLRDFFFGTPIIPVQEVKPMPQKSGAELEMESHIGKLVICISNEVENITVGVGKEIQYITKANQPMLVVHDIVTGEEIMPFGIVMRYTEQKFNALNNMDPLGRTAILYYRLEETEVEKTKGWNVQMDTPEVWKQKVDEAIAKWKASKN